MHPARFVLFRQPNNIRLRSVGGERGDLGFKTTTGNSSDIIIYAFVLCIWLPHIRLAAAGICSRIKTANQRLIVRHDDRYIIIMTMMIKQYFDEFAEDLFPRQCTVEPRKLIYYYIHANCTTSSCCTSPAPPCFPLKFNRSSTL